MLKRLELAGFKSFAAPTDFSFGPGLTAIVGPNGSGKSNVVDAIRWVLGEQSARSLRGDGMADVIFAGTARQPARTFAEVSLTLDNHGKQLASDANEVRLTRRVDQDGRGMYLVNGQPARLRDVKELLLGSGTGCAFIAQGQVDSLLHATGEQRRLAIEEAAGIARLRSRREEAGQKLAQVREHLDRLAELRASQERQLASVRQQAAKAHRHKLLQDELRRLQLQLFYQEGLRLMAEFRLAQDRQHQALAALESARSRVRELETKVAEDDQCLAAKASLCLALERRLAELRIEAATLGSQRRYAEEKRQVQRAETAKAVAELQVRLAAAQEACAAAEAAALPHPLAANTLELSAAEAHLADLQQMEQSAHLRLASATARFDTLQCQLREQDPIRLLSLADLPAWRPPTAPAGCLWAADACQCELPQGRQLLDFLLAGILLVPDPDVARNLPSEIADALWIRSTQELHIRQARWPAEEASSLQAAETELRLAKEEWSNSVEQVRQAQDWLALLKVWQEARREVSTAEELLEQERTALLRQEEQPMAPGEALTNRELMQRWAECHQQMCEAEQHLQQAEIDRDKIAAQKREQDRQLNDARQAVDSCWQFLHEAELAAQRAGDQRAALESRVEEELHVRLADLLAEQRSSDEPQATAARCSELRQQLERLGGVNLDALAELERLEPEARQLEAQQAELCQAKDGIERLLAELDQESQQAFHASLAVIRKEFQAIFARLFGGGAAEILLTDEADPLRSGIELIARPPGKEPRTLNLLSGGEKALTAVAFLLALFRARPSPFCIMDEVDAALDEANVARLADLLRDFAADCQFILVSHSRRTLAAADVLYGVTMQEPGVSTRVAVRLNLLPALSLAA